KLASTPQHANVQKTQSGSLLQSTIFVQANFARYLVKYHLVPNLWDLLVLDYSHIASWTVPMLINCLTMPGGFATFWAIVKREFEHPDWRVRLSAVEKVAIFARQLDESVSKKIKNYASAGNRTRVARVAGEHSTTEPPMLLLKVLTGGFNGSAATQITSRQPQTIATVRGFIKTSGTATGPTTKPGHGGRAGRFGGGRFPGATNATSGGAGPGASSSEVTRFLSNSDPVIMCAVAHVFSSLVATLDDCSNVIAQQSTIQLSHISNRSLNVCIRCLEHQFDTVPSDRCLILKRMQLLASALPDRQIFNWDFFLNRFGLLAMEAQMIGKPNIELDQVTDLNQHNRNSEFFQQQFSKAAFACLNTDVLPSINQTGVSAVMVRKQGENTLVTASLNNRRSARNTGNKSDPLPQLALIKISYDAEMLTMAETLKREQERYIALDLDPHYARLASIANAFLPDGPGNGQDVEDEDIDQIANLSRRHSATFSGQLTPAEESHRRDSRHSFSRDASRLTRRLRSHSSSSLDRNFRRSIDPVTMFGGRRKRPSAATYNLHTTSLLNEAQFSECTNKFLNSIQEVLDLSGHERRSTLHLWVCLLLKFMTKFELEPDLVKQSNGNEDDIFEQASGRSDLPLSLSAVGGHRGFRTISSRDELRDKKALSKIQRHLTFLLGYSDQAFNIPPYKLRSSTVFHAFISNVAGLLDRNYAVGNCILPQTLMILQYCPSPQRYANDSQPPTFTLRTLDRHTRLHWLNTFLVILYK
ncbi:Protein unc-79, partial [Cichlidogyrus casuarinus]